MVVIWARGREGVMEVDVELPLTGCVVLPNPVGWAQLCILSLLFKLCRHISHITLRALHISK